MNNGQIGNEANKERVQNTISSTINLSDFYFESHSHQRVEPLLRYIIPLQRNVGRGIRIEVNINGIPDCYTVSIINLGGNHPVWGDNFQLSPKRMRVVEQNKDRIVLRGFGVDDEAEKIWGVPTELSSFDDYGLTLILDQGVVRKCQFHRYDTNHYIEYYRGYDGDTQDENHKKDRPTKEQLYNELRAVNFIYNWLDRVPRENMDDLINDTIVFFRLLSYCFVHWGNGDLRDLDLDNNLIESGEYCVSVYEQMRIDDSQEYLGTIMNTQRAWIAHSNVTYSQIEEFDQQMMYVKKFFDSITATFQLLISEESNI